MQTQNEYMSVTPSPVRANRRQPIREGDQFKSSNGEVWKVIEVGLFGNGHECFCKDRASFISFQRATLESMERL